MRFINIFKRYLAGKQAAVTKRNQAELSQLTVVRLKAAAKERGFTGYSRLSKADLVKLLS